MAKKQIIIRIDEQVLETLQKWAADEFRSMNGQLEWVISKALREAGRLKKDLPPEEPPPASNEESHPPGE